MADGYLRWASLILQVRQEDKTADLLANKLEKLGFDVSRGIGKKGVVAIYENGEGPTLMIRADMDLMTFLLR